MARASSVVGSSPFQGSSLCCVVLLCVSQVSESYHTCILYIIHVQCMYIYSGVHIHVHMHV